MLDNNRECQAALEVLLVSPLYDCRCKRGMKKELQCLQNYWTIHMGLTEGRRQMVLRFSVSQNSHHIMFNRVAISEPLTSQHLFKSCIHVKLALALFIFFPVSLLRMIWVFSVICFLLYSLCGCEFSLQHVHVQGSSRASWSSATLNAYKKMHVHCRSEQSESMVVHHTSIDMNVYDLNYECTFFSIITFILNECSDLKYQCTFRAKTRRMYTTPIVDALFPDALLQ